MARSPAKKTLIGWKEWGGLPKLGVRRMKVKVDTGARTSALHADGIRLFRRGKKHRVRFRIHPLQKNRKVEIEAEANLVEHRNVRSSAGHVTNRPVIKATLAMGRYRWPIEITLVRRDLMGFRMLLGRQAIRRRFMVDPDKAFLLGKPKKGKTG